MTLLKPNGKNGSDLLNVSGLKQGPEAIWTFNQFQEIACASARRKGWCSKVRPLSPATDGFSVLSSNIQSLC
jgi:hypothetical protein